MPVAMASLRWEVLFGLVGLAYKSLGDCRFSEENGAHTNTNELSELHDTGRPVKSSLY